MMLHPSAVETELVIEITIPRMTPSNNEIRDMHWLQYKKLRETYQLELLAAMGLNRPREPVSPAYVEFERYSAGILDWDNANGGVKPLMDCLVLPTKRNPNGLGLVVDDSPRYMPKNYNVMQRPAKRGEGKTVVRIYRLPDPWKQAAAPI